MLDGEIVPALYDSVREEVIDMISTKEVTEQLGIDKERIKYYKRMNVFCAESERSGYYAENDVKNLRKLVMLGKAGLTCDDIKKAQSGETTLMEVLTERRQKIKEKMERMLGSLCLSQDLLANDVQYESLEIDRFWKIVNQREDEGKEFMEFEEEDIPLCLIRTVQCPYCDAEQDIDLEEYVYDENPEDENDADSDIIYSVDSEENYDCECCGETFRVMGWTREYPVNPYYPEDISVLNIREIEDGEEEEDDYE